jgi:hypothetical protein
MHLFVLQTLKLVSEVSTGAAPTHMCMHGSSALCSVAGDDLVIRMFDVEASRLVRRFKGHK